ncbi:Uncharacterised protein [Salmonella enterica subsp. arizonae]|uniref:Uncharacterized protein n=1 Tax=Salmonella enterica subsp. arizonae TaxID=59203 RepID=A0A3S4K0G0_SALER|nr:Uncharacterised protein [Salmonella enterica subsp. arizonae]
MEMIFRNIPLARSGHSDKRGDLSTGTLCMIPAHSYSKAAPVFYKNTLIGMVKNLTFADLRNGVAELRGDIILDCSYSTIAEMAFDEVYPSISVSTTPNDKAVAGPYLATLSMVNREEREFEDQQPLDLSGLRVLVKAISESEAPESAVSFNKKYDNANSGFIGYVSCNDKNKIYLNEKDTLEAKDGYLVIKTSETTEAVKIEGIGIITSTKNKKGTNDICISTTSCGVEIRNSDIGTSGILKFIERYKKSQFAELKISC